ncbi:MAG: ABC transporter ATP-binding protein [Acidobacteria bacterium]|nr:MAG: ABC transporter ATP-binding protein [Acidobacteriota bacterium]
MPTEAEPVAARASRVSRRFGEHLALRDVDLELEDGQITVLLGANGAGKTTLLRLLAAVLPPSAGTVEVLGVAAPAAASGRRARGLRRRLAYLAQRPSLDPEMTGGEILHLVATLYGLRRRERRRRVAGLAAAFGVDGHLERRVAGFSGGLRRRLHLAAGLVHDPQLLLLDEPAAGLDDQGRAFLWAELVRRAGDGRAVAVVTHDLTAAERHAHKVAILDGGSLLACDSPGALIAELGRTAVAVTAAETLERRALERAVAGIEGVAEVAASGGRGRVVLARSDAVRRVLAALAASPLQVLDLEVERPSLASVYRRLTGREPAELLPRRRGTP